MPTRRETLGAIAGTLGATTTAGRSEARQSRIARRIVIPEVEEFGDYVGQFVHIDEPADEGVGDVPIEECGFASTWPADETQAYEGQLLDRRQEAPLAIDLTVYMNGNKAQIEPGTYFIVQNTQTCPEGYVGLEAETVRRQALAGEPPGPTVTSTDGPGFGVTVALAGAAGGGVLAALGRLAGSE